MSNNKYLRLIFSLIISAELLSFIGYYYQIINFTAFFAIALGALILSLRRLEYGLWILLAELFIGSFGYLFYLQSGGLKISLRIALWLIIMSVWLGKILINWLKAKKLRIEFFHSSYFYYFLILFIFIFWGVINGLLAGNALNDVFFDFNNWLYFLLIFPLALMFKDPESIRMLKQIFIAAAAWLSLKTLILAYFFSHSFSFFTLDLYRWARDSGAGEITQVAPGFSRVFMQSHIFVLIGFFILLFYFLKQIINNQPSSNKKGFYALCLILAALFLSAIIISFSRSFWVGLAAGGLFAWLAIIFRLKIKLKQFIVFNSAVLGVIILSLALTAAIIKFPYPRPAGDVNAADLLGQRATAISGEAGASSRWQLLPPLWQKISGAPLLGRGLGATVTYKTSDPRALESNPGGLFTAYAFEWGWLDVWLKLGILGPLAFLALFAKLIFDGLKINLCLSLSLAAGLFVLAAVNIFSPYLNHPLGIGYLILAAGMMENLKSRPG